MHAIPQKIWSSEDETVPKFFSKISKIFEVENKFMMSRWYHANVSGHLPLPEFEQ